MREAGQYLLPVCKTWSCAAISSASKSCMSSGCCGKTGVGRVSGCFEYFDEGFSGGCWSKLCNGTSRRNGEEGIVGSGCCISDISRLLDACEMTQSHRPLRFVRCSLPRCLLLRPCPTQHSPYGLTRKSTRCVITRLIQEVVGEIQFNRGKVCTLSHKEKTWKPMCLSIIWCIYFLAGEGHPLLGNHGAS